MKKQLQRSFSILLVLAMTAALLAGCGHTHAYGQWQTVSQPTCTQMGSMQRSCECGDVATEQIPMIDHSYENALTKLAGCKTPGEMTYTCRSCGHAYTEEVPSAEYDPTTIFELYEKSVGEVVVYDKAGEPLGLGSCFVYRSSNELITNYHVIEGACAAEVTFGDDTYSVEKVLAYDPALDLAVLQIQGKDLRPAILCQLEHPVGSAVYALGNSKGLTSTFSDGMITTAIRELDGVTCVQHDAPISPGNSGGPLINAYGEVIGINTWFLEDSQNLNFAIHLSELEQLDYSTPMTLQEVYDAECNPFELIKEHILSQGELDDGDYYLDIGTYISDDGQLSAQWMACFDVDDDELWLFCSSSDLSVAVIVDRQLSGQYDWFYGDAYDTMYGTMDAATFDKDTVLTYENIEITSTDTPEELQTIATLLMQLLCMHLNESFADLGITAADLGFLNY